MLHWINKVGIIFLFMVGTFSFSYAGLVPGSLNNVATINTTMQSCVRGQSNPCGNNTSYYCATSGSQGCNSSAARGPSFPNSCNSTSPYGNYGFETGPQSFKSIVLEYETNGYRVLDDHRHKYCFNQCQVTQNSKGATSENCQTSGGVCSSDRKSCYVTGGNFRAKIDDTPPTITITGDQIFVNGQNDEWCNIKKYRQEGYTYKADENPGCESMKTRAGVTGTTDLLNNLQIVVEDPGTLGTNASGIGKIQVVIGNCKATFVVGDEGIKNLTTSTSVKTVTLNKTKILSKLSGKTRLDECLVEGKNYLIVGAWDAALTNNYDLSVSGKYNYSDSNFIFNESTNWPSGSEPATNFTKRDYNTLGKYVNIDASTPKLQLGGDLTKTSLTGGTQGGGFEGTISNDSTMWRNYSLTGTVKVGEKFAGGVTNECKNFSGSVNGDCSQRTDLQKPQGGIWVLPKGVNPTTGKYTQYKCDTLPAFPTNADCAYGCPAGQTLKNIGGQLICDGTPNLCSGVYAGGVEVIENVTGKVIGGVCYPYCMPSHIAIAGRPSNLCITTNTGVLNGVCGTAHGKYRVNKPTDLCVTGNVTGMTGSGPWSRTCSGANGGTSQNCTTNKLGNPTSGVHVSGTNNIQWKWTNPVGVTKIYWTKSSSSTTKSSKLTAQVHNESGLECNKPYSGRGVQSCDDIGHCNNFVNLTGTSTLVCPITAINGVCGSASGTTVVTAPVTGLCNSGTPTVVNGTGPWNWICNGVGGGSNATCTAFKAIDNYCTLDATLDCILEGSGGTISINGTCGSANGTTVSTAPSGTSLCSSGNASAVGGSGPWSWTCNGSGGGTNANCSANKTVVINGTCGSANGTTVSTAPSGVSLCSAGTASTVSGSGPWSWTCNGSGGGTNANCSANKTVAVTCPTGWAPFTNNVFDPGESYCVSTLKGPSTYSNAQNDCTSLGGYVYGRNAQNCGVTNPNDTNCPPADCVQWSYELGTGDFGLDFTGQGGGIRAYPYSIYNTYSGIDAVLNYDSAAGCGGRDGTHYYRCIKK